MTTSSARFASRRRPISHRRGVDLGTQVGSLQLTAPVLTAAGTSGHGAELQSYFDLSLLGAVVVKSLSVEPWPGNLAPRVRPLGSAMLNSVGLQGPGIEVFIRDELPTLEATGASVVVSIWGRRVDDYAKAASLLTDLPPCVSAVEVNVSCPNVEDRSKMFAHSASATHEVLEASACGLPLWAKLSPNVANIVEIAGAALAGGAEALVLVNTLLAMGIDVATGRPSLGAKGGGLSGAALHGVAIRAVFDCRSAFPDAGIVGVGGVRRGTDAIELLMAGADAVGVGTATFMDPRAPLKVVRELKRWCRSAGVSSVREIVGVAQGDVG